MKRQWLFRMHRDAAPEGGTGGFISITDLVNGKTGPTDLNEEVIKNNNTPTEGLNPDGTLQPGYKKEADGTVVKDPEYKEPVEGLNEDGTPKAGYKLDDTGKVVKDPDYKEGGDAGDEGDQGEPEGDFWAEVQKITGRELKIEYPEGIDPETPEGREWLTTPEGVAHRIKAERLDEQEHFEQYLQQKHPRAYALMLHLDAGGTEEDFFTDNRGYTLPTLEQLAGSADVQAAVYKHDLIARGLDEDAAQALVEKAIKDNKLKERSETAWKGIDTAQKKQLEDLRTAQDRQEQQFRAAVDSLSQQLEKQIREGLNFIVPETQQPEFKKFVMEHLRYDNGKFFVVQEVGQDPKTLLESLFFQHKKGDLKTLVQRQVKTQAAQGMRLKLKGTQATPGSGQNTGGTQTRHLPLSQILPTTT